MANTRIVVNIWGGLVQNVFSSKPGVELLVVDWDTEGLDLTGTQVVEVADSDGHAMRAIVSCRSPSPIEGIVGSEIEDALRAAGIEANPCPHRTRDDAGLFTLYDLDRGELVSTTVFCSYSEAADEIDPRQTNVKVVRIEAD